MANDANPSVLYILDGSYYIFRAFHAIRDLRNSEGFPTNGLFAFTNMLLGIIRDHAPTHLCVAFDPPGPSFRSEIDAAYKAHREAPPEELVLQMPLFRDIVRSLSIPILEVPGFEADDVIGTLVRHAERDDLEVVILSGDKDLCQLLDERTVMVDSLRGKRMDLPAVEERFQVGPDLVASVLALAGDTSDNIPGAKGVGEKTAGSLLREFGSLEAIFENLDRVSGTKRRENLEAFREQAPISLALTTIRTDVPLELTWADLALSAPDFASFERLCARFEFRRFPDMLRSLFPEADAADAAERLTTTEESAYEAVVTLDALEAVLAKVREAGAWAIDLETTSLEPMDAEIVGFAIAWSAGEAVYVPVAHTDLDCLEQLSGEDVLERLRPFLEDEAFPTYAQNARYEIRVFARHGVTLRGLAHDPMIAAYLLDPNRRRYGLDALAHDYLDHRMISFEDVAGRGKKQRRFDEVAVAEATRYAAEDADWTLRLVDYLAPRVEAEGMQSLLTDVELPLVGILAEMETIGVRVDVGHLRGLREEFLSRMEALEDEIHAMAGEPFLLSSPKQLAAILFEKLGLPVVKKTKTGASTDQEVLEVLAEQHPLPAKLLAWRQLSKLQSTYVESLPLLVHPRTGRVHTSWQQTVAATGRLSSAQPNLQNIPVRSEEGLRIREAFVPEDGWTLLSADYSQIELRLLAHLSREPVLIDAFQRGEDIHRRTAAEVFEVSQEEVTREQRGAAKTINFGVMYGMGAQRLAGTLGISRAEASAFIERYFERIGGVRDFFEAQVERATRLGYASTLLGRRRPLPELVNGGPRMRAQGERLAINTPIQGSAADLIKLAMVRLQARLQGEGLQSRMIMQVHDELVVEVAPGELDALRSQVVDTMQGVMTLDVPLVVDVATGANWAALKDA